jgi:hypothetical protein
VVEASLLLNKGPNSLDALRFSWCTFALLCNECAVAHWLARRGLSS